MLCLAFFGLQTCKKHSDNMILKRLAANMVPVAGGTFTMGCTAEQGRDCWDNEKPAHSVTLSSFKIGKYEVTQEEWTEVMGSNPSYHSNCPKCPVEQVSWNDVQSFLKKLNARTGGKYRLPTEAEWEYAARGGKSGGYRYSGSNSVDSVPPKEEMSAIGLYKYSGSNSADKVAWYDGSGSQNVGQKGANELGLYDMSGNVWEWCSDWYGDEYYSNSPSSNPSGPSSGTYRMLRGGSWHDLYWGAGTCRVSSRNLHAPEDRNSSSGFRLVSPGL